MMIPVLENKRGISNKMEKGGTLISVDLYSVFLFYLYDLSEKKTPELQSVHKSQAFYKD